MKIYRYIHMSCLYIHMRMETDKQIITEINTQLYVHLLSMHIYCDATLYDTDVYSCDPHSSDHENIKWVFEIDGAARATSHGRLTRSGHRGKE